MKWINPLLPVRFDKNEIYTIVIFLLISIILKVLPKKMETSFFLFLYVFNIALTAFWDYLLAGNPINLYDTLDKNSGELFDFLLHFFIYPMTMLIILTFYSFIYEAKLGKVISFVFILLSSSLLLCLEWVSERFFNLFTYFQWTLAFSFFVYFLAVSTNIATYLMLKRYYVNKLYNNSHN
jgi:hypothetical protein